MLSDDMLYVKLFDADVPDYEAPEILNIQRAFRQCCKLAYYCMQFLGDQEQLFGDKEPFVLDKIKRREP